MKQWGLLAVMLCVEWVRFTGTVKAINMKVSSVTIQNRDGDLVMVPIDYQVKIMDKGGDLRSLKDLQLDQKVTLLRVPSEPAPEEPGLALPEHGR